MSTATNLNSPTCSSFFWPSYVFPVIRGVKLNLALSTLCLEGVNWKRRWADSNKSRCQLAELRACGQFEEASGPLSLPYLRCAKVIISMNLLWICRLWDPFEFLARVDFFDSRLGYDSRYPDCFGYSLSLCCNSFLYALIAGNGYCLLLSPSLASFVLAASSGLIAKTWNVGARRRSGGTSTTPYTTRIKSAIIVHPLDFHNVSSPKPSSQTSLHLLAPCHVFSIFSPKFGICSSPFTTL